MKNVRGDVAMRDIVITSDYDITQDELDEIDEMFLCYLTIQDFDFITLYTQAEFDDLEDLSEEDIGTEYNDMYVRLKSGRIVYIEDEVIHKEDMAQID